MYRLLLISLAMCSFSINACLQTNSKTKASMSSPSNTPWFVNEKGDTIRSINKSEAEWKESLDQMAYYVLREQGTERAYTGKYHDNHKHGMYYCAGCGLPLFSSETKFESGTGWPSFYAPIDKTHVQEFTDNTAGMSRTEVTCHRCGGHLGHVFDDGPRPTGLRYCMNSVSLAFEEK